jgi:hypothetical protein
MQAVVAHDEQERGEKVIEVDPAHPLRTGADATA